MKKVRLTENDLVRIIERVIKESEYNEEFFFKGDSEDMGKNVGDKPKHDWAINPSKKDGMDAFKEKHPKLYDLYFAKNDKSLEDDMSFDDDDMPEDDFEFEDSKLAEMKRRVKVMENNLRRKKQLKRK